MASSSTADYSSSSPAQVTKVNEGKLNIFFVQLFNMLIKALYREFPNSWKLFGSSALYVASNYFPSGENYRYLHTELVHADGTVVQCYRDIDICVTDPDPAIQEKISSLVRSIFSPYRTGSRSRLASTSWADITNRVQSTFSFKVMPLQETTSDITNILTAQIARDHPSLTDACFKIDITQTSDDSDLSPSSLSRAFTASYNGVSFSFGFIKEMTIYSQNTFLREPQSLNSLVQSTLFWLWNFRSGTPGYTGSGDKIHKMTNFRQDRESWDYFKTDFYGKNVIKAIQAVFSGKDTRFQTVFTPAFTYIKDIPENREKIMESLTENGKRAFVSFSPSEEVCPLCQQDFKGHSPVHVTECGHVFHLPCWLSKTYRYYLSVYRAARSGRTATIGENTPNRFCCDTCRHDCGAIPIPHSQSPDRIRSSYRHPFWKEIRTVVEIAEPEPLMLPIAPVYFDPDPLSGDESDTE